VSVQLLSKISNLCGPDPPTSQTDGQTDRQTDRQTDDMRWQDRAMHHSASRGKNYKIHKTAIFLRVVYKHEYNNIAYRASARVQCLFRFC